MILMLISAVLLLSACGKSVEITPRALTEDEKACYEFVKTYMINDGGMSTNYYEKPLSAELATGGEVLSESQGLLMAYTADIADRDVFEEIYNFTKEHMDNGKIFPYRYNPMAGEESEYTINAAVDDLRIIKALFNAGDVFSDRVLTKAAKNYADRFYKSNVENNRLYDFYDSRYFMKNSFITLCYLDLQAIQILAKEDKRYKEVYENSLVTLEEGYINDEFPMFMTRYDYSKNKYEAPNGINMVEAVLTALNLAYAESCPDATIAYLKKELEKGKIYASYEIDGTPKDKFESTAIYALSALLAKEIGDEQMYEKSISLMKKFMITNQNSPLYGAFGDEKDIYSFDNLMALTALRKGAEQ